MTAIIVITFLTCVFVNCLIAGIGFLIHIGLNKNANLSLLVGACVVLGMQANSTIMGQFIHELIIK